MSKSIIGANAAIRYLKDYHSHVQYWHSVNPVYSLAYVDKPEHAKYIQEYAAEFPDSMIVARIQHPLDGGFHFPPEDKTIWHYVASPQNYHNDFGWLGRIENVILNVFNEPDGKADDATIQRLVEWMREYIPIAVQNGTKSVLFNWGKGQPRIFGGMMDARFGDVLKLAALYPELFYIGCHFYGPEDITESIRAYVSLCNNLKIKPLRVIGTEWGNDARVGGEIEAKWEISQIQHDLSEFVKSGVLVGVCRFQDGNSGGWEGYAIENDIPYKNEIKRAAQAGELEPVTTTPPTTIPQPKPVVNVPLDLGIPKTVIIQGSASWNLRVDADPNAATVGTVKVGESITIYPSTITSRVNNWYFVVRASAPAGESATGWIAYVLPVTAPLPTPPIVGNPTPIIPDTPPSVWARLYAAELKVAQAHYDLAQLYKQLDEETKLNKAA
jgi:hypothetical protein